MFSVAYVSVDQDKMDYLSDNYSHDCLGFIHLIQFKVSLSNLNYVKVASTY